MPHSGSAISLPPDTSRQETLQRRASKLRAYGNAIVPQVAAEVVKAYVSNCRTIIIQ